MESADYKFTLTIQCETKEDVVMHSRAVDYKLALDEIWNVLFRPRHKHGYGNPEVDTIIQDSEEVNKVMDLLEERYRDLLQEYEINL
jgi:hypothetical protein